MNEYIIAVLQTIGENPARPGLKDTPKRVEKMYAELFAGYKPVNKPKITTFPNGEENITYDELIIDTGEFASMCEHHMIPFFGSYTFGYFQTNKVKSLG